MFLRVLRFSHLFKKQHFQIPIRSGTHEHISTSSKCSVGKQITIFFYIPNKRCDSIRTDWWNECSRTKKYVLQARRSHENCHKRHDTRNYRDPQQRSIQDSRGHDPLPLSKGQLVLLQFLAILIQDSRE